MKRAFPELKVKSGKALTDWGAREHWWCEAPDGAIYDPTKAQFPHALVYDYIEATADMRFRVARCLQCGVSITARLDESGNPREEDVYSYSHCSEACEDRHLADLNSFLRRH